MTASKSQSHSARDNALNLPKTETTGHDTEPSPSSAHVSGNGHDLQIPHAGARPHNRRYKGRPKHRIQNHPQWSAYLSQRHILEPVIAAGIWVERDKSLRRDALVLREKRRDGSPGAVRLRFLPSASGDDGAAKLAALLLQAGWKGEAKCRKVEGASIPHKGDSNDLLCHHYPDLASARAALDALPKFLPQT